MPEGRGFTAVSVKPAPPSHRSNRNERSNPRPFIGPLPYRSSGSARSPEGEEREGISMSDETDEPRSLVYKHLKTGDLYVILEWNACIEESVTKAVVYRRLSDGVVEVRPYSEFMDGRFECVTRDDLRAKDPEEDGDFIRSNLSVEEVDGLRERLAAAETRAEKAEAVIEKIECQAVCLGMDGDSGNTEMLVNIAEMITEWRNALENVLLEILLASVPPSHRSNQNDL